MENNVVVLCLKSTCNYASVIKLFKELTQLFVKLSKNKRKWAQDHLDVPVMSSPVKHKFLNF